MNAVLILLVAAALLLPSATPAQQEPGASPCLMYNCDPPDSCLAIIWLGQPDSVLRSTCTNKQYPEEDLLTDWYARHWFHIEFKDNGVIQLPWHPDTIMGTWQNINENFQQIKSFFQQLELVYGKFYFVQSHPDMPEYYKNLISFNKNVHLIFFEKYQHIGTIDSLLRELPFVVNGGYLDRTGIPIDVAEEPGRKHLFSIYPNPGSTILTIELPFAIATSISIDISEISGRPIVQKCIDSNNADKVQIDISFLPSGTYIVRCDKFSLVFTVAR